MLKVLTSNSRFSAVSSAFGSPVRIGTGSNAPLLRFLNSLRSSRQNGPYLYRRFFCSDSTDGSDPAAESEAKRAEPEGEEAVESKTSSAMVPTVFRPEDCLTVSSSSIGTGRTVECICMLLLYLIGFKGNLSQIVFIVEHSSTYVIINFLLAHNLENLKYYSTQCYVLKCL